MTARSQRRAAEQAVIEAARLAAHQFRYGAGVPLNEALAALDDLGLETPGRARANKGAPVTAQQAATWMNGDKARSVCAQIVRLLKTHPYLTAEEIQSILHGKHQTVSARINELRDTGWIVDTGHKRKTTSGSDAIIWRLSFAALEAINGQGGMPI